ncbi:MAG: alcohol dehydrogenase catalytic domain-containing protein [Chloroflexi bacterium]|nr:alcohol dehydrogenase catalytic domain-containing protein [Chloroflexota bacterium]
MLAVVLSSPGEFALQDVAVPQPGAAEVLLRVKASTICGTDQKIFAGQFPGTKFPHIPGHEFSGEVVERGAGVQHVAVADRVGVEIHVGCGGCPRCLEGLYQLCLNYGRPETGHAHIGFTVPGGLAEYVAVPARAVHKLPEGLNWDEGAFTDNIGIALYAIERGRLKAGERVIVVGSGTFGALASQVARSLGAAEVVLLGTRMERLERLNAMADLVTTDASKAGQADLVVEFAGTSEGARTAIQLARRGGRVVLGGSTGPGRELSGIDLSTIVRGHLEISGSLANPYGISARGLQLMARGAVDVKPLITHQFPLSQFANAWDTFVERRDGAIRVMLHP